MAFGDASYFIGILDRRDQWHEAAVRLSGSVTGRLHVTDVAMGETITLVGARSGGKSARRAYDLFLDACDIVYTGAAEFAEAMSYHTRYDGRLSTSDCLLVVAMVSANDPQVLSFDSDFDLVRGIERIH